MVELKLVWWPQFPTEEFEYHYLPLTATVGTPRFEYEEAPYFQRLLLHANAAQVTRKKAVISCLAAAMVHGIPVLNLERSTRVELNLPGKARPPSGYPEIFHYRNAYLPESDITVVRGYRVTTVERTFVDICAVNGELEGLVFLESALRRGYTKGRFQQYLDSNCGRWGISKDFGECFIWYLLRVRDLCALPHRGILSTPHGRTPGGVFYAKLVLSCRPIDRGFFDPGD